MAWETGEVTLANRPLRGLLVAGVMAVGLAVSLPNLATSIYPLQATFDFSTCDGVICDVGGDAKQSGIQIGDRLDLHAMTIEDRYAALSSQPPRPGQAVSLALRRGDFRYAVKQTAHREPPLSEGWLNFLAGKVAVVVLVVLASALFLANPTPVSAGLALFAAGSLGVEPDFYSFLPNWAYVGVDILSDGLFLCAAIVGFFWLALTLGRDRQRRFPRTLLVLFILLALQSLVQKLAIFWVGIETVDAIRMIVLACCLAPGVALLTQTVLRRTALPGERLAAALLATSGAALLADFVCGAVANLALTHHAPAIWQMLEGPAAPLREFLHTVMLFTAAAAAYVIVRERVVDSGLVGSRILSYGAILLGILAALGFLNWMLAPKLSSYPAAIPLEVIGAVAVGYWLSGFRDVSNSLALAAVDAPTAAMHGRRADENDALAHALGLAERTRQPSLIAEIRARCAFSAWVNCDDRTFEQHLDVLRRMLGPRMLRGVGMFAKAASFGGSEYVPAAADLPEWRARSSIVLSAGASSAGAAHEHATDAVSAADSDGTPWLRVLARVALAEIVPGERDARLDEAGAIASRNGAAVLAKSLLALRTGKRDCGLLQPFVDVRMRKVRLASPALEIEFLTGDVRVFGEPMAFSEKERALLFVVAASKTIGPDALADALWPESEGDSARTALRVCLHRLRRRAGDPSIVRRLGQAYALHPGATVDLWKLDALAKEAQPHELRAFREKLLEEAPKRATLGSWFAPFEALLARKLKEIEQSVASKSSGASTVAQ